MWLTNCNVTAAKLMEKREKNANQIDKYLEVCDIHEMTLKVQHCAGLIMWSTKRMSDTTIFRGSLSTTFFQHYQTNQNWKRNRKPFILYASKLHCIWCSCLICFHFLFQYYHYYLLCNPSALLYLVFIFLCSSLTYEKLK